MTQKETEDLARMVDFFERMIEFYDEAARAKEATDEERNDAAARWSALAYIWDDYMPEWAKKLQTNYKIIRNLKERKAPWEE